MTDGIPAIELAPPDISGYRGNTSVDYVTRLDSDVPGPCAMVSGVVHGNELCGAIALDYLFRNSIRPVRGSLILAFANVAAFQSFDKRAPFASRYIDEDLNRVWDTATLEGPRDSVELERARALRPFVAEADALLDLHSMQSASAPLGLCGLGDSGLALGRGIGVPELLVRDAGHAAGARMRDYETFAEDTNPKASVLIECGQHWEQSSAAVAIESTIRFLLHLGMITRETARDHLPAAAPVPQRVIEVTEALTIRDDSFSFVRDYSGLEVIKTAGTVIAEESGQPIRTPYDNCVLIMPSRRLRAGQTAVRLGRFA